MPPNPAKTYQVLRRVGFVLCSSQTALKLHYRAKAADFYKKDPKAVTDLDAASIQVAIKDSGMSAWSHYEQHGNAEKVNPSNSFDTEAYMNAKFAALNAVKDGKVWTLPEVYEAFRAAGVSALEHFMLYGGKGDGEVTQKIENGKIPAEFAVPESKKVNPGGGASDGDTYALTTGIDTFIGKAGNDTFIGDNVGANPTIQAADQIDGGAGVNTALVLNTVGAASKVILKDTGAALAKLSLTGDQDVNVTADANLTKLATVDTTAAKGDVGVDLTALTGANLAVGFTYAGGAGDDTLTVDGASFTATSGYKMDLGTGHDTLMVKGGAGFTLTKAIAAQFTGAEVLGFNMGAHKATVDASLVPDIKEFSLTGSAANAALDITKVAGSALTEDDTFASDANIIEITGITGSNIVIKGDHAAGITFSGGTGIVVDGSEFTGHLKFTAASGSHTDTITGGKGNDTLAGKGGLDTLTGGAGKDMFDLSGIPAAGATVAEIKDQMATITDFTKGEDKITLNTNGSAAVTIDKAAVTDFGDEVEKLLKKTKGEVTIFQYDGDTYIVNNADGTTALHANDQIIKLDGQLDLTSATVDGSSVLTWA